MTKKKTAALTASDYFESYLVWLRFAPLSEQSKRAYRSRINQFLDFLATSENKFELVLKNPQAAEVALREYKRHLKRSRKFAPGSVNATLTAIDHYFQYLGDGAGQNTARGFAPGSVQGAFG